MKKKKQGRKFSRKRDQRKALLKALLAEIFLRERIKTTQAKAKEARRVAEKFITQAKKGDLSSRRRLLRFLPKKAAKKLVDEIAPRYKTRRGGYTRIINLVPRKADGAKMAIIELLK